MTEETPPTPSPDPIGDAAKSSVVTGEEQKTCGCVHTSFADGRTKIKPCVSCAMHHAAASLQRAAQALNDAAVGVEATARAMQAPPTPAPILRPVSILPTGF